jgi:hypothetical protein
MAREYSTKGFLLEINAYPLLGEYFKQQGLNQFSFLGNGIDKKLAVETVAKIEEEMQKLDTKKKTEIERDFTEINKLATEQGASNLLDEAKEQEVQAPVDVFVDYDNHDKALWFFVHHPSVFNEAAAVQQFLDLNGWKRVPVPSKSIDFVAGKKEAIKDAFQKHYASELRGDYCFVDAYTKKDRVYLVVGVQDYAQSDITADNGKINKKGIRRPFFEIYFLYRPKNEDGVAELEIKARGGWKRQSELLKVFCRAAFDIELDDSKQTFDLTLLTNPNFDFPRDTDLEWWKLKSIELRTLDRKTTYRVSVSDDNLFGVEGIWNFLRTYKLDYGIQNMLVNRADFQMKFAPTAKHPRGTISFYINWKDTCQLNSIDELHIKAHKLLKKSGLDCGFTQ